VNFHFIFTYFSATARLCTEDIRLDDDLYLDKGTAVWPDIIALHRDPTVWGPDALEFRPERWLQKETPQQNGTANKAVVATPFYGFGEGPRMCVGKRLAIMQEKMAMVQVFRTFRLHPVDEINQKVGRSGSLVKFHFAKNCKNTWNVNQTV
jgi:cytochrome P450